MVAMEPRAAESLIAFWSEAGVDALYENAPVDRMAPGEARLGRRAIPQGVRGTVIDAAPGRALAQAAGDIAALGATIAAFEGCALKTQGARQSVFFRGALDAPVLVIGEAPGAEEDAQGQPFIGRAGRLLDRMLAAAGLEGRVFITNTVFWRPPGNRTPTPAEQVACAPFLERAIALVAPRLLLLVGAAATKSLLGRTEGILALRGRWFEWQGAGLELPALPTLHPAFLLRQPAAKKLAWRDLMLLAERLDRSERPA
jgi:DNA polymerase